MYLLFAEEIDVAYLCLPFPIYETPTAASCAGRRMRFLHELFSQTLIVAAKSETVSNEVEHFLYIIYRFQP
jgi:hypothetical protein